MNIRAIGWIFICAAWPVCFTSVGLASGETSANLVAQMKPREWQEVTGSHLIQVAYRWPPHVKMTQNGTGVSGVIANWSGGAYDTKRDRLLVWGGGHFAYAGNEIYAFDVAAMRWQRITDPSLAIDQDYQAGDETYADGTPRSNHTYGAIQYVPTIDRFCSFGTAATFPGPRGGPTTWTFDFTSNLWEKRSAAPGYGPGSSSAWDPVSGMIWIRVNGKGETLAPWEGIFASWDPLKDIWSIRGRKLKHKTWDNHSAAIDPLRRRYVAVGGGKVRAFDLSRSGPITQEELDTYGPQDIVQANSPGFEYDPVIDKFVGWNGGADVFTLDPDTLEWRRIQPAATNRVRPPAATKNGTFGRFRYMSSRNAYIVVNDVRQNVFIYKLSEIEHAPMPPRLLAASRSTDPALARWAKQQIRELGFR